MRSEGSHQIKRFMRKRKNDRGKDGHNKAGKGSIRENLLTEIYPRVRDMPARRQNVCPKGVRRKKDTTTRGK